VNFVTSTLLEGKEMEMELVYYPLILLLGFVSSFIGSSVGGGGMLIVPVFILMGLSPQQAVASKRVENIGSTPVSLYQYAKGGKVKPAIGIRIAFAMAFGALVGSIILIKIQGELLERIISVFILISVVYFSVNKDVGVQEREPVHPMYRLLGYAVYTLAGVTTGLIGGGGQLVGNVVLIGCFGLTFLEAAGTRKIATIVSTMAVLPVYYFSGLIVWTFGLTLMAGAMLGAYAGSRFALKIGDQWVRRFMIVVLIALALKLLI